MISICIPVYNFDIRKLLFDLSDEIQKKNLPAEIIVIDDHSLDSFRSINKEAGSKFTYIELSKNVGRASIRNKFAQHAKYDHLLFLDCDVAICSEDFIENYLHFIKHNTYNAVCGGRIYPSKPPAISYRLRWKYGIEKESKPAEIRTRFPNKSFMTNNFLVSKETFDKVQFDERIREYGHEDTLFGFMLKQKGLIVRHIDNPVMNGDIEDNKVFLDKTVKGVINLAHILEYVNYDKDFIESVQILHVHKLLKEHRLIYLLIQGLFKITRSLIKAILHSGHGSLKLFDFYKLGVLMDAD